MSRQEDLQKLIASHTRRFQKLREQEAGFGPLHTPAHILTEIEDTEAERERLLAAWIAGKVTLVSQQQINQGEK